MRARVTDYLLYRWRYPIGYVLMTLVILVMFLVALTIPGALRSGEITSSLSSGSLSTEIMSSTMVVNLPYHILQRASFMILGVTPLSIKIPSAILGLATVVGVFFLIRTWFRHNVAILITILTATTTQFLFLIQDGTPKIMYIFVAVWLLVCGTYVTRDKIFGTFWKVATGVLVATALYMPLGIYLVGAIITTAFFHPHIRHIIRHIPRLKLILAIILGVISIIPLIYASVTDISVLSSLVGIPTSAVDWLGNAKTVFLDFFGFSVASTSYTVRPLYSLGLTLLMALGAYKLLTYRYTARSYIVLILCGTMLPLMIIDPSLSSNFYAVAIILIAYGTDSLIVNWYKLFPRNPYARIGGLIPLGILACGIVFSGMTRYINSYTYSPEVLSHYSVDLTVIDATLDKQASIKQPLLLMTSAEEFRFYQLVARYDRRLIITTQTIPQNTPSLLVTKDGRRSLPSSGWDIDSITVSQRRDNADRLYTYKPHSK